MKKLFFVLSLTIAVCTAQAQVKFSTASTDAVHQLALTAGKPVFIDLYASWCPPCKMMEREVFSRKDFGDFMEANFISAKYDVDQQLGSELMARYGKGSIPLYLVFSPQGELLGRIQGASDAKELTGNLRTILEKYAKQQKKE